MLNLVLCLCGSAFLWAQNGSYFYKDFEWEPHGLTWLALAKQTDSLTALADKTQIQYVIGANRLTYTYKLRHRVLVLHTDENIEKYNKVYLPQGREERLLVTKARAIAPDGSILELDQSKVLQSKNEESGKGYRYFAFEGLKKGSIIEYYFVEKGEDTFLGGRVFAQRPYPVYNFSFEVIMPSGYMPRFRSYNQAPEMKFEKKSRTVRGRMKDFRTWRATADTIPALQRESLSAYDVYRMYIMYTFKEEDGFGGFQGYDQLKNGFDVSYKAYKPKRRERQGLKKILDAVQVAHLSKEDQIRAIDHYIKENFLINGAGAEDLEGILKSKIAKTQGMIMLYMQLFKMLDIPSDIVISCDRTDLQIDPEFETAYYIQMPLLYFPEFDNYLSPNFAHTRYGYPPKYVTAAYGLYLHNDGVMVKEVPAVTADKNVDQMEFELRFDPKDLGVSEIQYQQSLTGYYAMSIQPFYKNFNAKERKELREYFAQRIDPEIEILEQAVQNSNPMDFGKKAFEMNFKLRSEAITEKAGNNYLFKIGQLIGKQSEMYEKKSRVLPLEIGMQRNYKRKIRFAIPKGYTIDNLDDLNIHQEKSIDERVQLFFRSSYIVEDDQIEVTADEFYKLNTVSVAHFDSYRKVINAAADFNKVVLVLRPK